MKRHILENHIKFDCTECESTFSKQDDLIKHLNTEHEINRQCLICQQVTVYIRTVRPWLHFQSTSKEVIWTPIFLNYMHGLKSAILAILAEIG